MFQANKNSGRQQRILLIDPDADNLKMLQLLLTSLGFEVLSVPDANSYRETLQRSRCDLIIINSVHSGGLISDLMQCLEREFSSVYVPVLAMADVSQLPVLKEWINAGVDDFIIKPVHENLLYARIRSLLRMKDLNTMIKQQNRLYRQEMEMAKAIQGNLMSNRFPRVGKYSIETRYIPAMDLGGDFFDIYSISGSLFGIFIADVAGHGVQAALISMMVKGVFDAVKHQHRKPAQLMEDLNKHLVPLFASLGTFMTAFSVIVDAWTGQLWYSNAGHPSQYLFKGSEVFPLETKGRLLGLDDSYTYEQKQQKFESQDVLLLYTDGLVESINSKGIPFGEERLVSYGQAASQKSAAELVEGLLNEHDRFVSAPDRSGNEDDINIIAVKAEY